MCNSAALPAAGANFFFNANSHALGFLSPINYALELVYFHNEVEKEPFSAWLCRFRSETEKEPLKGFVLIIGLQKALMLTGLLKNNKNI